MKISMVIVEGVKQISNDTLIIQKIFTHKMRNGKEYQTAYSRSMSKRLFNKMYGHQQTTQISHNLKNRRSAN